MRELDIRLTKTRIIEDYITIQQLLEAFRDRQGVNCKHRSFGLFGDDWLVSELRKQLKIVGEYSHLIILNGYGQLTRVEDGKGNSSEGERVLSRIRQHYIRLGDK